MHKLVEKISKRTGMNEATATEALLIVSEHLKEDFPLLRPVVDKILGTQDFTLDESDIME